MLPMFLAVASPGPNVAVMVHGAGGGGWEYERWRPVFERAGWKVVAPDLMPARGGLARTSFRDYVKQVVGWAPRRHGRLVLVGASMGGILALKATERLKPDALILVNSVPPQGLPLGNGKPTPKVVRWAGGPLKDTRDAMPDSDEATILWAWKRWRDESGTVIDRIHRGVAVRRPSCPVLAIVSGKDTDVPPASGEALARWARAVTHRLPSASHVGPLLGRDAATIAAYAVRWIDERRRAAGGPR